MTPEQFRQHGHEVVDWIADYWARVGVAAGALAGRPRRRAGRAARRGTGAGRAVRRRAGRPRPGRRPRRSRTGSTPASSATSRPTPPGPPCSATSCRAGLGVQGMSWVTSPAATELEQHVMDWFVELLGLPDVLPLHAAPAVASSRTPAPAPTSSPCSPPCTGPAAARPSAAASSPSARPSTSPPRPTPRWRRPSASPAWAPTPSASSRSTATSPCARRRSPPASTRDVARGYTPVLVCATVGHDVDRRPSTRWPRSARSAGSTASGCTSTPPTPGSARSPRSCAALQAGVEWADSYTTDAHKWLLTGFDATLFWTADRAALTGALAILPEYLRNAATDTGAVVDYRDWQIPLGRRFRALKLWFVAPLVRRRGPARARPRARRARPGAGRLGGGRRPVRRRRAAPAVAGLPAGPGGPTGWTPTSRP